MQLKCDTYVTDTYILMRKYFIKYAMQIFYYGLKEVQAKFYSIFNQPLKETQNLRSIEILCKTNNKKK